MEATFAEYLSHAPVFVRTLDGEITYWTRGAQELYGFAGAEARGRISHELLQTIFPRPLDEIDAELRARGEWRGRLQHLAKDGRQISTESLWRLRDEAGAGVVVEQNIDISERVQLERQRDLLAGELSHRIKNTLAVVQGLARLSFAKADNEHVRQFEDRLHALGDAHSLLLRQHWEHAELREVLAEALRALHLTDRVDCQGPDASLRPTAAVAYALAFHELATNALKHGALKTPNGRIEVRWQIQPDGAGEPRIHLVWRELADHEIRPPERSGFGTRLIQRALAAELGGPVQLRFEPTGLVCEFDGPLQKTPAPIDPAADA